MRHRLKLEGLRERIRENWRDVVRVGLQTGVAAAATYGAAHALGFQENLSWAVIASLFTISVSADSSVMHGLGRIIGAFLGVALGLGVNLVANFPMVLGLAVAATAANMIASLWPNLRYAAVTAAIVALDPLPAASAALVQAMAILLGTLIGVSTTFLVWPNFGRQRAAYTILAALGDCEALLRQIEGGVETNKRRERDATHARFLRRLETLHGQISETYIAPRLRSGVELREVAGAMESLWHSLVILDRAISDERTTIGPERLGQLRPAVRRVQISARDVIGGLKGAIGGEQPVRPPTRALCEAVASARDLAGSISGERSQAKGIYAVVFALDEVEQRLLQIVGVLEPGEASKAVTHRQEGMKSSAAAT